MSELAAGKIDAARAAGPSLAMTHYAIGGEQLLPRGYIGCLLRHRRGSPDE